MNILVERATNYKQLLSSLKDIVDDVPGRADGRTKEMCEQWIFFRLFKTLTFANEIIFPVSAAKANPPDPDFIIFLGETRIGIEVTEATSTDYSAYLTFIAKKEKNETEAPPIIIETASFRPNSWKRPRNRTDKIQAFEDEAKKCSLNSPGWSGNEPEQEWANYIKDRIEKKLQKIDNYRQTCSELWLAVYVNAPLPSIHYEEGLKLLIQKLESLSKLKTEDATLNKSNFGKKFDKIYILDGSMIICLDQDMRFKFYNYSITEKNSLKRIQSNTALENFIDVHDLIDAEKISDVSHEMDMS